MIIDTLISKNFQIWILTLLQDVIQLLKLKIGDQARLEHIQETLENNNHLYDSDRKYLERLSKGIKNNPNIKKNSFESKTEHHPTHEKKITPNESKLEQFRRDTIHQKKLKKPVNLTLHMVLLIVATIGGPILAPISVYIRYLDSFSFNPQLSVNLPMIELAISALILIVFFQIKQIKKGLLLFVLLWIIPSGTTLLTYYVVGIITVGFNQYENAPVIGFGFMVLIIITIGVTITNYAYKLSERWNKQLEN